tara:strand:- start:210 stop:662 length:453 start_codon:yes stop_codon:yes gene_type:complete
MSWKTILKSYPKIQWVDGSRQTTRKFTDWMKMRDAYYNGFNLNNGKIPNSIFQIAKFTKILYENVTDTKINLTEHELNDENYDPDDFSGLGSLFGPSQTEINMIESWFDIHEGKIHVSKEGEKYFEFLINKFKVGENWQRGAGDLVILRW